MPPTHLATICASICFIACSWPFLIVVTLILVTTFLIVVTLSGGQLVLSELGLNGGAQRIHQVARQLIDELRIT